MPSGDVISQSPTAGTQVSSSTAVDLVVSNGPSGNSPASINVQLNQFIAAAGTTIGFKAAALDRTGNPVCVTPACHVLPDANSATGTIPVVSINTISIANDTRGVYAVTCSIENPALSRSAALVVLVPTVSTVSTTQQATFASFSGTTTLSASLLQQITAALGRGSQSEANAALEQWQTTLKAVDFDALERSAAVAPEGGFLPDVSQLRNFGILPTPQDANAATYLANLISALQSLTSFVKTTPLATLTTSEQATYTQRRAAVSTLLSQLPSVNPSAYSVVANVDQEDLLFSTVLPELYQAITTATMQYLVSNGFIVAATRRNIESDVATTAGGARFMSAAYRPAGTGLGQGGLHSLRRAKGWDWHFSLVCLTSFLLLRL